MANDRLSLTCSFCGWRLTMFKFYPFDGHTPDSLTPDKLGAFILKHLRECHPQGGASSLGLDSGFAVLTEDGEEVFKPLNEWTPDPRP